MCGRMIVGARVHGLGVWVCVCVCACVRVYGCVRVIGGSRKHVGFQRGIPLHSLICMIIRFRIASNNI